eukprot:CAMPEP_0198148730 /NCGR_PEP_ID=MMETSP1443-20131203/43024_1 /TAXON_ID=186043 /ORGANISM="Entomoneis sp., Strain CCMP2396" /LENGTH=62 /DNA_ID=CAMNT_0043813509 /DNA_START=202 /DNA_END=387 /DNA_ORIENTATION=-
MARFQIVDNLSAIVAVVPLHGEINDAASATARDEMRKGIRKLLLARRLVNKYTRLPAVHKYN